MNENRGRDFFTNTIIPFLTGFALGVMSALATFSGRISSLEAVTQAHTDALRDIRADVMAIGAKFDACLEAGPCRK